ncbi:hypothetical protein [Cohnella endophytica]|uniref:hypothetical protein n=1 Tax=Cohnella endophytica TaxID=2419778 RepID=UPI003898FE0E
MLRDRSGGVVAFSRSSSASLSSRPETTMLRITCTSSGRPKRKNGGAGKLSAPPFFLASLS